MQWNDLVQQVRTLGQYTTDAEAERVLRTVLSLFGGHVTGDERSELARRLPHEAAALLTAQVPATRPLTARAFVDVTAERLEGATPATARWDVSTVLSTVAVLAGDELADRVLAALPRGYALLFGRAELAPAA
ncbi:DUF2267 domain-containing protein [Streptomyces armeniacus]|uniref:DUF2267 domain-containing protein n=1 Tax=Streptomyces armeniacus TaxID=83291 RepID=A0A345XXT3_9ACTN|nr:DUF2267 domain-containing protein [Streptomyces armeniacus]AXK36449.1 DUF2267 domain-containing protein [Streptomyces armeniacus]